MNFTTRFILLVFLLTLSSGVGIVYVWADTSVATGDTITVLNAEIATRKDKIKQLETTIANYKKNIAAKQTEGISLKNQISIIDNHIGEVQANIDLTTEKIKETELEIQTLTMSIADKNASIDKQKKIIADIVQSVHAEDQKNYLEIMLTYSNFSDFYNQLKQLESVYVDLGQSVKILRVTKENLDAKRAEINAKQQTYQNLQTDLENQKSDLNDQVNYKQKLLSETRSSEQRYQTLLTSLKKQYQVVIDEERTFEDRVRKKLEEEDKIKASGDVLMSWPVPSRVINATFHDPNYPFRNVFQHSGVDIKATQGTPVHAAASGYVGRAKHCASASCYSYVLIIHTGNISSLYGHLSGITVNEDAFVNRGDVIGYSGGTPGMVGSGPFVTGPHLHFEVRLSGIPVDPMPYLVQ